MMRVELAGPIRGDAPATLVEEANVRRHFLNRGCGLEFEMEAAWVRTHLPSGHGRVVDLGCGIGSLFEVIGAGRAVGVDVQETGLRHTRARFPTVPLFCARAERLPFGDESLDGLVLQHVVEHLSEIEAVCRGIYRLLRPGGVLLLLTPNAGFCDWSVFDDPTHLHIFSGRDLAEIVLAAGFTVLDLRTLGLPWFRQYHTITCGWRLRRRVIRHAGVLSRVPHWRWEGQTLCCAARRSMS